MPNFQDHSVGFAKEVTFGTALAPTRWLEFTNPAPFKPTLGIKQGAGIRPGRRVARSGRRVTTLRGASGPINLELFSKGLGLLLELAFGSATSTMVSGSTYQQSFKFADVLGSACVQFGIANADGTITAHTYPGAVIESWELAGAVGDIATLNTTWDARELNTALAYGSPSYPAGGSLYLIQSAALYTGTITAPTNSALAVTTSATELANVKSFKVSVNNTLSKDRFFANQGGKKGKQLAATRVPTVEVVAEYGTNAMRDAWLNQAEMTLVIRMETQTALSVGVETFEIYIPCLKIDDDPLPSSSGADAIAEQTLNFAVLDNLTAADPMVVSVRTSDTAL